MNQVDVSPAKWFTVGPALMHGQVDVFNAFAASPVIDAAAPMAVSPHLSNPHAHCRGA